MKSLQVNLNPSERVSDYHPTKDGLILIDEFHEALEAKSAFTLLTNRKKLSPKRIVISQFIDSNTIVISSFDTEEKYWVTLKKLNSESGQSKFGYGPQLEIYPSSGWRAHWTYHQSQFNKGLQKSNGLWVHAHHDSDPVLCKNLLELPFQIIESNTESRATEFGARCAELGGDLIIQEGHGFWLYTTLESLKTFLGKM